MCLHRPIEHRVTLGRPYIRKSLPKCGPVTFSERASTRWSIGKILPSFLRTTVRPASSISVRIAPDNHLVAFVKLCHAIAGVYMCVRFSQAGKRKLISSYNNVSWETVMTVGFELDVLRGKRPYRWTIWVSSLLEIGSHYHLIKNQIYLGTRYFGLLGFVLLLINIDSVRLNCQVRLVPSWRLVQRS